ncbi:MAG: DUF4829 domain-containing protein [Vulcanimicrobiota bacterium]
MMDTHTRVLIVFLLVSVLAGALHGCSGNSSSPAKAAESYIQALQKNDYQKAWNLLSEKTQGDIADPSDKKGENLFNEKMEGALKDVSMKTQLMTSKVSKEAVTGTSATVTILFSDVQEKSQEQSQDVTLVKEKGNWKLSF